MTEEAGVGAAARKVRRDGDVYAGWNAPKPETIPRPTYWPAVLAFGSALIGLGVETFYLISAVGAVVFAVAMAGWIGEIHREQRE